ncbi:hypothetical protein BDP27DRAFT_1320480 [Rhodocollybia butyracea]|uniref:RNase H type-1 domain-containing protein n=1 Tax=Rhodocollybia butyracea TaxID=206335 RepID=A0A9P5UAW4_9AGAR|nr:hypothetical protein BDP27DRAFT_1320480 [Rhodocollybia butyracea]
MLLDKIQQLANRGTRVEFWLIPRKQNQLADQAAKRGATMPQDQTEFGERFYIPSIPF